MSRRRSAGAVLVRWARRLAAAVVLLFIVVFAGAQMGMLTGKRPENLGATNGRLADVRSDRWNAVSSTATTSYHQITPLAGGADPRATFARLKRLVEQTPGATVVSNDDKYLYAEFSTKLLKFVDDVEFLLDEPGAVIQVRSASRLGRKDFGVNRKRIEDLRAQLGANPAKLGN